MRILHVLAERGFSGGENQLLATLRYLQAQGHEQILAVNVGAAFKQSAVDLGLACHDLRFRNNYDPLAAFALRRLYQRVAPDLIHLACSRSHKIGSLAGAFSGSLPPRVVTRRMDYPIRDTWFHRWVYGSAVDAVVAISQGVREAILKIGVDPSTVHLINEGVDTGCLGGLRDPEKRRAARSRLGLSDEDIFGVTTASLHVRKAHDVLLTALAKVQVPAGRRVVWLFGGDGPQREALKAQAAQLPGNLEVRIPGQIDYVQDALAAADMFCLPSHYEGLGVALLEAISTGVPCIATRVGGMREVFKDGVSGLHVEVADVDGLARAIQSLIDDSALAIALGVAGKRRASTHFDVGLMGHKTESLYQILVDAGRK